MHFEQLKCKTFAVICKSSIEMIKLVLWRNDCKEVFKEALYHSYNKGE